MLETNYMIGVVTKDRYNGLDELLKSLRHISNIYILIIDCSDQIRDPKVITDKYDNINIHHNDINGHTSVVHNKNIIIHNFLKSDCDHLFLIEDDIKIIDCDVFEKYIDVSKKYNVPHMNYCGRSDTHDIIYNINNDIQISEKLQGVFCFYTRECLQKAGLMSPELNNNCWEHIEHTARIQQIYNYQPSFYHFPDIKNSWEFIKMQGLASVINQSKRDQSVIDHDRLKMMKLLNWNCMPLVSIKRFDLSAIKNYK